MASLRQRLSLALDCRALVIPQSGIGRYTQQLVRYLPEFLDPAHDRVLYVLGVGYGVAHRPDQIRERVDHGRTRGLQTVWEQTVLPWLLFRHSVNLFHTPRNYSVPPICVAPLIVTIHDTIPLLYPELTGLRGWSIETRFRRAVRQADVILTVSESSKRDIIRHLGASADRVRVIPLAPAELFFAAPRPDQITAIRHRLDLPGPFVVASGSTKPIKNIQLLLDIWPAVLARVNHHVPLVVVGAPWPGHPLPQHTSETIRFTGELADADLVALLASATLFVFPTRYEGFGLPPLEAMAAGTAVIASDRGALHEVLEDAAILLSPDDAQAWVDAIATLVQNTEARRALAERGRRHARKFTWWETVRRTVQVYRDVHAASGPDLQRSNGRSSPPWRL